MKKSTKLFTGLLLLVVTVNCPYGQMPAGKDTPVIQHSETAWDKAVQAGNFHSYLFMLEGQILDYADFTLKSHGVLSLVAGTPDTGNATVVPFYIYLKRNGKIVKADNMTFLYRPVCSIDIADVLSFSKAGDQLMIIPATQSAGKTKIILKMMC